MLGTCTYQKIIGYSRGGIRKSYFWTWFDLPGCLYLMFQGPQLKPGSLYLKFRGLQLRPCSARLTCRVLIGNLGPNWDRKEVRRPFYLVIRGGCSACVPQLIPKLSSSSFQLEMWACSFQIALDGVENEAVFLNLDGSKRAEVPRCLLVPLGYHYRILLPICHVKAYALNFLGAPSPKL